MLDRGNLRQGKQPAAAIRALLSTVRVQGASPKSHHSQGKDTVNHGKGLGIWGVAPISRPLEDLRRQMPPEPK